MSNGLICAYITGIHDKRIVTSCTMRQLPQTIEGFDYYLVYYPPIILRQYMPPVIDNLRTLTIITEALHLAFIVAKMLSPMK